MDELIINTGINTSGFEAGSKKLMNAIKSMSSTVGKMGNEFKKAISSVKRLIPMIIGVGSAYGVISKAVNAFMSENQQLSANLQSAWRALGNVLGPIITQIVNWVTTAISYFINFLKLLGVTSQSASEASKKARGAGSALQKQLMGFDELNVLQNNGGGGVNGSLTDKELPEWLEEMAELLKLKQFEEAGRVLARRLNDLVNGVDWGGLGQKLHDGLAGALDFLYGAVDEFDWNNLGLKIREFFEGLDPLDLAVRLGVLLWTALRGGLDLALGLLGVDVSTVGDDSLSGKLALALNTLVESIDTEKLGGMLSDAFTAVLGFLEDAIKKFDFNNLGVKIRVFLEYRIKWKEIFAGLKSFVSSAFKGVVGGVYGLLGVTVEEDSPILTAIDDLGSAFESLNTNITSYLEPVYNEVLVPFKDWLLNEGLPVAVETLASSFNTISSALESMKPFWDVFITSFISPLLKAFQDGLASYMSGFVSDLNILKEYFDDLTGWEDFKSTLSGVNTEWGKFGTGFVNEAFFGNAETLRKVFETLLIYVAKFINNLGELGAVIKDVLSGNFGSAWEHLQNLVKDNNEEAGKAVIDIWTEATMEVGEQVEEMVESVEEPLYDLSLLLTNYGAQMRRAVEDAEGAEVGSDAWNSMNDAIRNYLNALYEGNPTVEEASAAVQRLKDLMGEYSEDTVEYMALQEAYNEVTEKYADLLNEEAGAVKDASDAVDEAAETASTLGDTMSDVDEQVAQLTGDMSSEEDLANQSAEAIRDKANAITELGEASATYSGAIVEEWGDLASAVVEGGAETEEAVTSLGQVTESTLSGLSSQATTWGADIGFQLASGMNNTAFTVAAAARGLANIIHSYLGFSEPEKGPLSDFHTYMPDMVSLMAKGIEENKGKAISAVSGLADGISSAINSVDTMGIEGLRGMFNNVAFSMPAVAMGGVTPYGIDTGTRDNEYSLRDVVRAVEQLRGTMSGSNGEDINWSVNVFLDGRQLTDAITRIQKQDKRAGR